MFKAGANNPLRIAVIAHSLYPIAEPYAGGLELITQLLCNELVKRGHEVTLYAHEDSDTLAKLRPFMSRAQFDAHIYPNEHDAVGMTRDELYQYHLYQDAMREIIEATHKGHFDIVHNHSLHHVPMLVGQALGSRLITTFHTPIFAHLRLALLTLKKGTDTQFTSVSQFQQQLFNEFVPSTVVYNGIDVHSFSCNTNKVADESYFWFGRICPEKGTHLAMQYCQKANKKLVIAGPKSNLDYFNDKVTPLLEQDNIANGGQGLFTYVGHLTKDDINAYLMQSTAMLFTSIWDEPYGLTLAESLASGCPVIGFEAGASQEIITNDSGIIVPKLDEDKFIAAFDSIMDISRKACRTRAESFCSVVPMVDGYLTCYLNTVNNLVNKRHNEPRIFNSDSNSELIKNPVAKDLAHNQQTKELASGQSANQESSTRS